MRRIIQSLHILALDAPLIGIAWQQYFAHSYSIELRLGEHGLILGSALWLGYMADRLFDVRNKNPDALESPRHRFAYANQSFLWAIWGVVLIFSIIYSLLNLNSEKIVACLALFFTVLVYNLVNQSFWHRYLPKELCVALLFSAACLVLLDAPVQWLDFSNLSLIIFLNCILLSKKEQSADERMGVSSLAQALKPSHITGLISGTVIYFAFTQTHWLNPFLILSLGLLTLHLCSLKSPSLSDDFYRFLLECLFCILPLGFLL